MAVQKYQKKSLFAPYPSEGATNKGCVPPSMIKMPMRIVSLSYQSPILIFYEPIGIPYISNWITVGSTQTKSFGRK